MEDMDSTNAKFAIHEAAREGRGMFGLIYASSSTSDHIAATVVESLLNVCLSP